MEFYSKLFASEPTRLELDCAKWMLADPHVNFAISTHGDAAGIDHLGLQNDDASELSELKARARSADMSLLDEGATTCCYANSEKYWITDPQGIAWEHFHTLSNIPASVKKRCLLGNWLVLSKVPAVSQSRSMRVWLRAVVREVPSLRESGFGPQSKDGPIRFSCLMRRATS